MARDHRTAPTELGWKPGCGGRVAGGRLPRVCPRRGRPARPERLGCQRGPMARSACRRRDVGPISIGWSPGSGWATGGLGGRTCRDLDGGDRARRRGFRLPVRLAPRRLTRPPCAGGLARPPGGRQVARGCRGRHPVPAGSGAGWAIRPRRC